MFATMDAAMMMGRPIFVLLTSMMILLFSLPAVAGRGASAPINAVLGDASWVATHGDRPTDKASEVERIRTHLLFVIERLSDADGAALTDEQRARRVAALDGLREYAEAGVFPRRSSDDGFGERRPRFIDDRGVHCAVGEMIRRSGRGELAEAIDERFEYAYVPDIKSQELAAWARVHGFTSRELAMIQPQYATPPSKQQIRDNIVGKKDNLTIACAEEFEVPESVVLDVRRKSGGRARISTGLFPSDFAKCVRDRLQESHLGGGGAWSSPPSAFRFRMTLEIMRPSEIAKRRLETITFGGPGSRCLPRPGAVPDKVELNVRSSQAGLTVDASTTPRNDEVDTCMKERLRNRFRDLSEGGRWDIALERTVSRKAMLTEQGLANPLFGAGHECGDAAERSSYTAKILASTEQQGFSVRVLNASDAFQSCMENAYNERARSSFSVSRRKPDGTYERYFRLLDDAEATIDFEVAQADTSRCPDGGRQVSIGGSTVWRCEGRTRNPRPRPRHF